MQLARQQPQQHHRKTPLQPPQRCPPLRLLQPLRLPSAQLPARRPVRPSETSLLLAGQRSTKWTCSQSSPWTALPFARCPAAPGGSRLKQLKHFAKPLSPHQKAAQKRNAPGNSFCSESVSSSLPPCNFRVSDEAEPKKSAWTSAGGSANGPGLCSAATGHLSWRERELQLNAWHGTAAARAQSSATTATSQTRCAARLLQESTREQPPC